MLKGLALDDTQQNSTTCTSFLLLVLVLYTAIRKNDKNWTGTILNSDIYGCASRDDRIVPS